MGQMNYYLDTNIYVYFFENNPEFGTFAEKLFSSIISNKSQLTASPLLTTELLVKPFKDKNNFLIDTYKSLPTYLPNLEIIDFDLQIAELAAKLRAKYTIKTPDAIHLATAIISKANFFITTDEKLQNIKEIPIKLFPNL